MKKYFKPLLTAILLLTLLVCCTACGLLSSFFKDDFALETDSVNLKIGESFEVKATGGYGDFTLASSDESKVSVSGKTITARWKTDKPVIVTAENSSGETADIAVTVDYADVSSVKITADEPFVQLLKDGDSPKEVTFSAVLNGGVDPDTEIKWTVFCEDTAVGTGKGKTFSFTPSEQYVGYVVQAEAGGVAASQKFGAYDEVYASFGKTSYKAGTNADLQILFYIPEGVYGSVAIEVTSAGGEFSFSGYRSFKVLSDGVTGELDLLMDTSDFTVGTYEITVKVDGKEGNKIYLTLADYVAANHVSVSAEGSLEQHGSAETVTFTASTSPKNTNPDEIKWYVNDVCRAIGATYDFRPDSYGEYVVTASIDGVTAKAVTVVRFETGSRKWNYTKTLHSYGGYAQNSYIASEEELRNVILYAIENQIETVDIYVESGTFSSVSEAVKKARDSSEESGILPGYSVTEKRTNEYEISISYYADDFELYRIVNSPDTDAPDIETNTVQSASPSAHYSGNGATHEFYIDTVSDTMAVSTSNMLYKAVAWGYKPVFTGTNAANLQSIYENAKDALGKIVNDGMTDLEKVHAIYDWIVCSVRYDHDCADAETTSSDSALDLNNKMRYYGFYLEGIFLDEFYGKDMHAVCDGKSKAFVLMCGIEGINAVRVSGVAGTTGEKGGHAWNKVLLDADDDGANDWFVVDTTWGDTAVGTTEYLSHAYFLVNDSFVKSTHAEKSTHGYPAANGVFDYYKNTTFTYLSTTYDLYAESTSEISAIVRYADSKGMSAVEFKVKKGLSLPVGIGMYYSQQMKVTTDSSGATVYLLLR